MAEQGDAYPDPKMMLSRNHGIKTAVCIGFVAICLISFAAAVSAPDPFPDPPSSVGPIFIKQPISNLPFVYLVAENQVTFIIE